MRQHFIAYSVMLIAFLICITSILQFGSRLQSSRGLPDQTAKDSTGTTQLQQIQQPGLVLTVLFSGLHQNLQDPISLLLLQVIVIIATAGFIGFLFLKFGQPAVIGEMLAGIILGPSVLGMLSPRVESFLFPSTSMQTLSLLSQIGIILFMLVVGINLDLNLLRRQVYNTVIVSHASMLVPFLLGTGISLLLYPSLGVSEVSFNAFALFMGISMSITAFPVLVRIIEDRGLSKTFVGTTAIACAAVDDVTAWCVLAFVLAMVRTNGPGGILVTLLLTLTYIGMMIFLIRPGASRLFSMKTWNEGRSKWLLPGVLTFTFASALLTELIGIHALFGAFLAGVAIPFRSDLRIFLKDRLEAFSSALLLPIFFAFTGLRTQIGLLVDWQDWLLCAAIIAIAIVGKLGGSMLAARWTGIGWLDSATIGTLMNSRGLVELIALNIGYDLGILSPRIFTMMVLMALITTFMTGPILSLIEFLKRRSSLHTSATGNS